jgi:hypothetical protein
MRFARSPLGVGAVVAVFLGIALAGAASAQTTTAPPYPGAPTTVVSGATSVQIELGTQPLGSHKDVSECNFARGTTVTIVVNGTSISPPSVVDTNGCIVVHIDVLPNLVALRAGPSHPFAVVGYAATANDKVQVRVNGQTLTVGPPGTSVNAVSNGTGSNGSTRTVTVHFTVTNGSGGLVRTGARIAAYAAAGCGLVAIGYLLILAARRRRVAGN